VLAEDDSCNHFIGDRNICNGTAFDCALRMCDYELALRVWQMHPCETPSRMSMNACAAGNCERFQTLCMTPMLRKVAPAGFAAPVRLGIEPSLLFSFSSLMCLHGAASYWRARVFSTLYSREFYQGAAFDAFLGVQERNWPMTSAEEQADWLFCVHKDGFDILRITSSHNLMARIHPDTEKVFQRRFRAPTVNAVAVHLPVEDIPELIASYLPVPFEHLF
jgi:hypothetical protein